MASISEHPNYAVFPSSTLDLLTRFYPQYVAKDGKITVNLRHVCALQQEHTPLLTVQAEDVPLEYLSPAALEYLGFLPHKAQELYKLHIFNPSIIDTMVDWNIGREMRLGVQLRQSAESKREAKSRRRAARWQQRRAIGYSASECDTLEAKDKERNMMRGHDIRDREMAEDTIIQPFFMFAMDHIRTGCYKISESTNYVHQSDVTHEGHRAKAGNILNELGLEKDWIPFIVKQEPETAARSLLWWMERKWRRLREFGTAEFANRLNEYAPVKPKIEAVSDGG